MGSVGTLLTAERIVKAVRAQLLPKDASLYLVQWERASGSVGSLVAYMSAFFLSPSRSASCVSPCPTQNTLHKTERHETMEICVTSFDGENTVEVGVDDTTADIRRKVATAAELCEDGFDMSFGEKLLAEGDDTTQLSAGDTVVLTKTKSQKDDAIAALRDLGETRLTSDRFNGLEDPKLVHLFLQAEVVTEIPYSFLRDETFEELDLSGVPGVTQIERGFLQSCTSLHTLDLSGWSNVTRVDTFFLFNCTSLTTLDMSGWNNVRQIGDDFLSYCSALRTLDLSGWNNVTRVYERFLFSCTSLTTLDISGWNNVTQLGRSFLAGCSALQILDLSGWKNVTRVDDSFLFHCTSLTTLDISGWHNVRQIGRHFLKNCSALQTLDLSGWTTVQHIEADFLKGCKIPTSSINVTGSSSVVSEYVHGYSGSLRKCVCM